MDFFEREQVRQAVRDGLNEERDRERERQTRDLIRRKTPNWLVLVLVAIPVIMIVLGIIGRLLPKEEATAPVPAKAQAKKTKGSSDTTAKPAK